ncbi:MAG: flagellin biosynthesis protein FlgH [Desulfobacteraceae bacterium 4572_130]|nr:MAG: flagellin biosynthesis protein FlgH [Desulfobacteraceae bacterium 4572_130]
MHFKIVLLFIFTIIFTQGCIAINTEKSPIAVLPQKNSNKPFQPEYIFIPPSEGSLWTQDSGNRFFEDTKASRIGDTVIIDIVENSSSSMNVNTTTGKNNNTSVGISRLFGKMTSLGAADNGDLLGANYTNSFAGTGKNDRSGSVTASIAGRIIELLPNGNLSIFGKRSMKVNNETQHIVVSGIVRPEDITSDNRIKSTYLADSKIEYYGKGALADKQKVGWGTRIIDNIWPF